MTNVSVFLLRIVFQPFEGNYRGIKIADAWEQMQWSFPYQIQCMGLAFVLLYYSGIVNLKTVLNASKDLRPFYRSVGVWAILVTLSILLIIYMKDADRRAQYLNDWLFLSDFLRSFLAGALILWLVPQELGRNIGTSPAQLFEHFLRTRREGLIEELKTMDLGDTEKCFVAVGYAISHADGAMHAAEVSIIKGLLWKLESLEFADFSYPKAKEYLSNPNLAWANDQARLLQDMAPLMNKPLLTDLLLLFGEAVSRADSNVSESEKQVLDAIYAHMKADKQQDSDELLWLRSCSAT